MRADHVYGRHSVNAFLDVKVKQNDLAYTLSERRSHYFHRAYIVARGSEVDSKIMVQSKKSGEHLRQPEFPQPLVTAQQLVLLIIIKRWDVHPQSVVGHSLSEITATCVADYITKENVIKAAFYRGQSTKCCRTDGGEAVGMFAVGLGPDWEI